jgi:class 3 adenylate cyclase/tetratricopeptide (TPR) repeat protein
MTVMGSNKMVNRCISCSSDNGSNAKYCQNCGQPLTQLCTHCGSSNLPDAKFCSQCGIKIVIALPTHEERLARLQQSLPNILQQKIRAAKQHLEGERKPIAILFTDIVGSTALAEALDPEEWREIVSGAHKLIGDSVYKYEGTIAQLLGDGVLAFFGAPITHEDDPLRAVHAGMEIQIAMRIYRQKVEHKVPGFQMRVGIHTGLVIVGNIGDDLHMEYLAVGDAVNVAARLQSLASPGKVLISNKIFKSVSYYFECSDLGMVSVKGKQKPVHIYQVEGIKGCAPGKAANQGGMKVMVGREAELAKLLELTASVEAGIGRTALIVGEPGVGKSRLGIEWRQKIEDGKNTVRWIEGRCISYEQGNAYHLVVSLLHSILGISAPASEINTRNALKSMAEDLFQDRAMDIYPALCHLLSLRLEDSYLVQIQKLDPISLQATYTNALKTLLRTLASQKPLVVFIEDLHWADPSSTYILSRLLPLSLEFAVFYCFTSRNEQDSMGWQLIVSARATLGSGLIEMHLQPLTETATDQMVLNLLNTHDLAEEVRRVVMSKAEGNPLFVEEVIRTLIECGALVRQESGWVSSPSLNTLEIPDNLKRLVLSRIDRLSEEPKFVLRIASVIGREFLVKILEQVYLSNRIALSREKMILHLHALEYANLVRMAMARPELRYLFYHAIIHEVTYETMLKSDRKILHHTVAEVLEQVYPDRLKELAGTLGYHYFKGDVPDKAIFYLEQAAEVARSKFANQEAIELYNLAIEIINQDWDVETKKEDWSLKRQRFFENLGDVYHLVGQHKKAYDSYQACIDLIEPGENLQSARLRRKMGNTWVPQHRWDDALLAYQSAENTLGPDQNEAEVDWWQEWCQIQTDRMLLYYWTNQPEETNLLASRVRPALERYGSPTQKAGFYRGLVMANIRMERYRISGQILSDMKSYLSVQQEANNPSDLAFAYFLQGFTFLWHGDLDNAEDHMQTALKLGRQIGDIIVESRCLTYLTVCCRMRGQIEEVIGLAAQSEEIAKRANMPEYIGTAMANLAWAAWRQDDISGAEKKGLAALKEWGKIPEGHASCAFEWTALLPLIAVAVDRQLPEQAIGYVLKLSDPTRQRLPDSIEGPLISAVDSWEKIPREEVLDQLKKALFEAKNLGYL